MSTDKQISKEFIELLETQSIKHYGKVSSGYIMGYLITVLDELSSIPEVRNKLETHINFSKKYFQESQLIG